MKNEILSRLPASYPWRGNIHYFDTIDSTNTQPKRMAADGAPHGTVLIADTQTGGRGRMGRSFHSPAGSGIYLSMILRPNCVAQDLLHLTCATAVAAADGIQDATGLRPGIKWTNDLVYERKKLGGILTELALNGGGNVDYAVVGIGINCNQTEADFDMSIRHMATSARIIRGREANRNRLIAEMVSALSMMDRSLFSHRFDLMQRYKSDCMTLGRQVSILRGDEVRHAVALDIDPEGGLVVQYDNGERGTVTSGEVSVRGLYGYI